MTRRAHAIAALTAGVTLLVAVTVAHAAVPDTTGATHGTLCVSLRGVKSFHGHVGIVFAATATGSDTAEGGSETISLVRSATGQLNLSHRETTRSGAMFSGTATIEPAVNDTFSNTGTGFSGQEQSTAGPVGGFAMLAIDSRAHKCRYNLIVYFTATASFTGDEQIQPDDHTVDGSASSGWQHLPDSLHPSRSVIADTYNDKDCTDAAPCYSTSGGWTGEFGTLTDCHSVETANCTSTDKRLGTAQIGWTLTPTKHT